MKKVSLLIFVLFAVILAAFFLRLFFLPEKMSFLYDQGRDALIIRDIIYHHKFTLIGPPTDVPGIFHGPLFYYLILPGYWLFGGHPFGAMLIPIIFSTTAVYLLYRLASSIFDKKIGLIAAILMAFSYAAIAHGQHLSNIAFVSFFSLLFIYALWQICQKSAFCWWLILVFAFGCLFHFQVVNALLFIPLFLLIAVIFKIKLPPKKIIAISLVIVFLFLLPYLAFDLRHDFLVSRAWLNLFHPSSTTSNFLSLNSLNDYLQRLSKECSFWLTGKSNILTTTFFFLSWPYLLFLWRKTQNRAFLFLFLWLVSTPFLLVFSPRGLGQIPFHLFLSIMPGFFIVIGILFSRLKIFGWLMVLIIIAYNFWFTTTYLPTKDYLLFLGGQGKITFDTQLQTMDKIYQIANNRPFSYEAFTVPYWHNDVWEYLFQWYGQKRYRQIPVKEKPEIVFLILEPETKDRQWFIDFWLKEKDRTLDCPNEVKINMILLKICSPHRS